MSKDNVIWTKEILLVNELQLSLSSFGVLVNSEDNLQEIMNLVKHKHGKMI